MRNGRLKPKISYVAAWIVYDMGNTLFFTGIVGLLFPLWVTTIMGGNDATIAFALSIAMSVTLVVAPVIGALSDQLGVRAPFLTISTLVCIAATTAMGVDNLLFALTLFVIALIAIHTADIFYNAMLRNVSSEETVGKIGGLGVGVGYFGAITAVVVSLIFTETQGYVFSFRIIALLFLCFSIPLMILGREPRVKYSNVGLLQSAPRALTQLIGTLHAIRSFPGLTRFLLARFWYMWAINTSSAFAVLYGTETVGFTEQMMKLVLVASIVLAIPSGLLWGQLVDRITPVSILKPVLFGWALIHLAAFLIPILDLPKTLWWGIGIGSGILMAGVWSADRPLMLALTPSKYLGEFFGLHSMVGRLSQTAGPLSWGLITVTFGLGQPIAVLSLTICMLIGFALICGVRTTQKSY